MPFLFRDVVGESVVIGNVDTCLTAHGEGHAATSSMLDMTCPVGEKTCVCWRIPCASKVDPVITCYYPINISIIS